MCTPSRQPLSILAPKHLYKSLFFRIPSYYAIPLLLGTKRCGGRKNWIELSRVPKSVYVSVNHCPFIRGHTI